MLEKTIRNGLLTTVITLIVSVLGIMAAMRIPVQMIPDLDVRVISIRTTWPGATPQDVEKELIIEQEEYLRNLPNLARIISTAESGQAEIELEFPFGTDVTEMLIRVNNALSQVPSYPENVDEPRIYANSFSSNSFMFFRVVPLPGNPRHLDMDLVLDFLEDNVKPQMASVTGVSEINVGGGSERQIQIMVDPERLAQRRLQLSDIRSAIRERNRDRSGGEIESGKRQYLLRTIGRFEDLDALRNLVLSRDGDVIVRLKDVATVSLDHFEKSDENYINGNPSLMISVRREAGSNVIDIKQAMLVEVERLNQQVLAPAGLEMSPISDDVRYVEESIRNVWQNLFLGSLFAIGVMYLFLRNAKSTLIGVMGIPFCIIVAFLGLLISGRTINVISMAGIAFAIGMTLDNSIVVMESIALERRKGKTGLDAAIAGVKAVWPAVFASTMTTVLVFLPIAFVEQEAGQLYSDVAIAISAAIIASMITAVTLVPTALGRISDRTAEQMAAALGENSQSGWQQRLLLGCRWLLRTAKRRYTCIAATMLISGGIIYFLTPPAEYLPEGEEPKLFAMMNAPPGYNLAEMHNIGMDLEARLLPYVEADPADFASGAAPVPALKYINMGINPQSLRIITEPVDAGDIEALTQILTKMYEEYPGVRPFVSRGSIITSNDGGTRSINLDISGPNLQQIFDVALKAYRHAGELFDNPRIQTSPGSLTLAQPMVEVHPNWERAAEAGLSADTLGFTVAALTDGSFIDEFFMDDDKIDIYLYSTAGQGARLADLSQLPIYTPRGDILPLESVANIIEKMDTSSIRRVNGNRTVTLNIIPPRSVPLETGVATVTEQLLTKMQQAGEIPAGVSMSISGAADQLDATRNALSGNYLVALFIIYLLLVAIFSHWGYPLLIMISIPLGIAGGIVGLWVLNAAGSLLPILGVSAISQPFDMISMLGFLILMGTVVNNPILIVHRAVDNLQNNAMNAHDAVMEALEARLRPIAMSTITTLCGLAPLVLIPGSGTELYRGVGAIVMFGILGATLVTLTMLPALTIAVLEWVEKQQQRPLTHSL